MLLILLFLDRHLALAPESGSVVMISLVGAYYGVNPNFDSNLPSSKNAYIYANTSNNVSKMLYCE
ncbi:hypothetical protein [Ehrlichia muris]|uniref:hypothetical protein n=1 Tax=Ehrlichia muris TaxID=35795 RepID=UPI0037C09564